MRFMNEWDIGNAQRLYADHPVLGPATTTLRRLADWANANSDGWAYWPKPARSAAKLMELIEGDPSQFTYRGGPRKDVTPAAYRKALAPIKAFRTRQGADFEIVEVAR